MMNNMTDKERAARMQRLRVERGMSQSQLARASGVNLPTIQHLENGVNRVMGARLETVMPIARALGVTVEEMVGETIKEAAK